MHTVDDSVLKVTLLPYSAFHSNAAAEDMATRASKIDILTICRLTASKGLPAFRVGTSRRLSRGDIDVWIRKQSTLSSESISRSVQ